jgi:hypothetical protein
MVVRIQINGFVHRGDSHERTEKDCSGCCIDGHWIGVFVDTIEPGTVSIYNSFGADADGSERVRKTVCEVMSALG